MTKPQSTRPQSDKVVLAVMLVGIIFVLALVIFLFTADDTRNRGTGGEDGVLGGDFTLTSANGDVSLNDLSGQVVVLYFGFVNCSQVCPTSMRVMQQTLQSMSEDEINHVQMALVSVDVDNDNADIVETYVKRFHNNFIGLTGTLEQINHVIDEYGSYYSPTELKDLDETRAYQHSSRYYIINRQGQLVDAMRHGTTANELRARLRQLI